MIPNPILKVLSTFKRCKVKCLLIGGQACIIYGAAEFSRDSDFVVLCEEKNLQRLRAALKALKSEPVYVPPLEIEYLLRGHACHFRCGIRGMEGLRVDVLSKLRGCDLFEKLWDRRKTVKLTGAGSIDVIGLKDLVRCKKTQRDKDWLMLKRLVENDIVVNINKRTANEHARWWLLECRTPETLIGLAEKYPATVRDCLSDRPLLAAAVKKDMRELSAQLQEEERIEREKDIEYWTPLKKELETLRRTKKGHNYFQEKKV